MKATYLHHDEVTVCDYNVETSTPFIARMLQWSDCLKTGIIYTSGLHTLPLTAASTKYEIKDTKMQLPCDKMLAF